MPSGKHEARCPRDEDLSKMADGERLPETQFRLIEGHLEQCDACRATYERYRVVGSLLKDALGRMEDSEQADVQGSHVSCEMLGTYLDGGPESDERARIEQHLAQCGQCLQELVSLRDTLHRAQNEAGDGRDQMQPAVVDAVRRMPARTGGPESGTAVLYCMHCSSRVSPTSTFCQNCGRMLGTTDESHPVWPAVVGWVRERRMHYLSLILAVAALFAASFHPFRKYQFYAIAALAAAKWIADVAVNGFVRALVQADPAALTESSQLRHRQMVAAVITSLSGLIARHAWLLASGAVFSASLLYRPHFRELVIIGTALALKWIINESGIRLAISLLQAWRSRDTEQVDKLLAQLHRPESPQKRKKA